MERSRNAPTGPLMAARAAMQPPSRLEPRSSNTSLRASNTGRRVDAIWPSAPILAPPHNTPQKDARTPMHTATSLTPTQLEALWKEMDGLKRQVEANNTNVEQLQRSLSTAQQQNAMLQNALQESHMQSRAASSRLSSSSANSLSRTMSSAAVHDAMVLHSRLQARLVRNMRSTSSRNRDDQPFARVAEAAVQSPPVDNTIHPNTTLHNHPKISSSTQDAMRQAEPQTFQHELQARVHEQQTRQLVHSDYPSVMSVPDSTTTSTSLAGLPQHSITTSRHNAQPGGRVEVPELHAEFPQTRHPLSPVEATVLPRTQERLIHLPTPPPSLGSLGTSSIASDVFASQHAPGGTSFPVQGTAISPSSPIDYDFPLASPENAIAGNVKLKAAHVDGSVRTSCPRFSDASSQTDAVLTRSRAVQTEPNNSDMKHTSTPLTGKAANAPLALASGSEFPRYSLPTTTTFAQNATRIMPRRSSETIGLTAALVDAYQGHWPQNDRLESMKMSMTAKEGPQTASSGSWFREGPTEQDMEQHPALRQQSTPPHKIKVAFVSPTPVHEVGGDAPDERPVSKADNLRSLRSVTSLNSFQRSERNFKNYAASINAARRPGVPASVLSNSVLPSQDIPKSITATRSPSIASFVSSSTASRFSEMPQQKQQPPPFEVPTRSSSTRARSTWSEGRSSPAKWSGASSPKTQHRLDTAVILEGGATSKPRATRFMEQWSEPNSSQAPDRHLKPPPQNIAANAHAPPPAFPLRPRRSEPYMQSPKARAVVLPPVSEQLDRTHNSIQYSTAEAFSAAIKGVWMWKVARKQGLFGNSTSFENKNKADVRHKRWVWLVPSSQSLRWSSKQQTNPNAVVGKNVRQVKVHSVLDVKAIVQPDAFNRSIMVLTEGRTIKFTALSREHHFMWLTALSSMGAHSHGSLQPRIARTPGPSPPKPEMTLLRAVRAAAPPMDDPNRKSSVGRSLSLFRSSSRHSARAPHNQPIVLPTHTVNRVMAARVAESPSQTAGPQSASELESASPPAVPRLPTTTATPRHSSGHGSRMVTRSGSSTSVDREDLQPQTKSGTSLQSQDKIYGNVENAVSTGTRGAPHSTAVPVHGGSRRGSHRGSAISDEELGGNSAFFGAVSRQRSIDDIMSRAARQMSEQASQSAAAWRGTKPQHWVGRHARTLSGDGVELPPDVPRIQLRRKGRGIFRREDGGTYEDVREVDGSAEQGRGEEGKENDGAAERDCQEFF